MRVEILNQIVEDSLEIQVSDSEFLLLKANIFLAENTEAGIMPFGDKIFSETIEPEKRQIIELSVELNDGLYLVQILPEQSDVPDVALSYNLFLPFFIKRESNIQKKLEVSIQTNYIEDEFVSVRTGINNVSDSIDRFSINLKYTNPAGLFSTKLNSPTNGFQTILPGEERIFEYELPIESNFLGEYNLSAIVVSNYTDTVKADSSVFVVPSIFMTATVSIFFGSLLGLLANKLWRYRLKNVIS